MYFAGIYSNGELESCVAVVVEKVLRNARKEYVVTDIRLLSPIKEGIKALYEDTRFLRKKKVFSQDRRPPKNTFTPPVLIVAVKNGDPCLVNELRNMGLPVDGLFFHDEPGWVREEQKILRYGANLFVQAKDMEKLEKVLASAAGIQYDEDLPSGSDLQNEIKTCLELKNSRGSWPDVFQEKGFRLVPALMLALWHCETIRQIKRY